MYRVAFFLRSVVLSQMYIIHFVGVLRIVMSKKLIWLSDSSSAVNFMFGWSVLNSSCMILMSVWQES